jgi:hypothetical protein
MSSAVKLVITECWLRLVDNSCRQPFNSLSSIAELAIIWIHRQPEKKRARALLIKIAKAEPPISTLVVTLPCFFILQHPSRQQPAESGSKSLPVIHNRDPGPLLTARALSLSTCP